MPMYNFCRVCNDSDCTEVEHDRQEPVSVILTFDNPADKKYFLGQLSDGWGENVVEMNYERPLELATTIHIKPVSMRDIENDLGIRD